MFLPPSREFLFRSELWKALFGLKVWVEGDFLCGERVGSNLHFVLDIKEEMQYAQRDTQFIPNECLPV